MAIPGIIIIIIARPNLLSMCLGLVLASLGELIRIWALGYIGNKSRSQVPETEILVTWGPYSYTRNPLYWGNFLEGLGIAVASAGEFEPIIKFLIVITAVLIYYIVYVRICIPYEESYLLRKFGKEFKDYSSEVPRVAWRLRPYSSSKCGQFSLKVVMESELWTWIWLIVIFGLLLGKLLRYSSIVF